MSTKEESNYERFKSDFSFIFPCAVQGVKLDSHLMGCHGTIVGVEDNFQFITTYFNYTTNREETSVLSRVSSYWQTLTKSHYRDSSYLCRIQIPCGEWIPLGSLLPLSFRKGTGTKEEQDAMWQHLYNVFHLKQSHNTRKRTTSRFTAVQRQNEDADLTVLATVASSSSPSREKKNNHKRRKLIQAPLPPPPPPLDSPPPPPPVEEELAPWVTLNNLPGKLPADKMACFCLGSTMAMVRSSDARSLFPLIKWVHAQDPHSLTSFLSGATGCLAQE
jgi:hypothetical protein